MDDLWYLGSPYSHPDAWMRELRFRAVSRVAGALRVERGIAIWCPIAHSHPISEELKGVDPTDVDFWLSWDKPFEQACKGLIICSLPGWVNSKGLIIEGSLFRKAGKTVEVYYPREHFTATEWAMLEAGRL